MENQEELHVFGLRVEIGEPGGNPVGGELLDNCTNEISNALLYHLIVTVSSWTILKLHDKRGNHM